MTRNEYYQPLKKQILKLLGIKKEGDELIARVNKAKLCHYIWVICQPYTPIFSEGKWN